jgi:phage terminase large subunit-like protein
VIFDKDVPGRRHVEWLEGCEASPATTTTASAPWARCQLASARTHAAEVIVRAVPCNAIGRMVDLVLEELNGTVNVTEVL